MIRPDSKFQVLNEEKVLTAVRKGFSDFERIVSSNLFEYGFLYFNGRVALIC